MGFCEFTMTCLSICDFAIKIITTKVIQYEKETSQKTLVTENSFLVIEEGKKLVRLFVDHASGHRQNEPEKNNKFITILVHTKKRVTEVLQGPGVARSGWNW